MILMVCFGKRGYGLMAHNLAFSIKHHSPNVRIGIWIDEQLSKHLPDRSLFDDIRILPESLYRDGNGKIDPAIAKSQIYRLGSQMSDSFLYLDVDALCLNPVEGLLEDLKGKQIATEIIGTGKKDDKIEYSIWATSENIYRLFELDDDATLCAVQSSWAYFERCEVAERMQEWLDYYMAVGVPKHILLMDWGGTLPDELLYQGVYAKLGIVPDFDRKDVIFFGHSRAKEKESEVVNKYTIMAMYGNGGRAGRTLTQPKWLSLYNKKLREYGSKPLFKAFEVMGDKHANSK